MRARRLSTGFTFMEILIVALIGILAIVKWGMHSGQDLGPDLVNYHFYNAYVAFHKERLLTDILPAGIQGYLNPYLYVLPYLLFKVLSPKGVGIVMGALHGLCFISTYVVSRLLLANWSLRSGRLMAFACAVFGVMNPFFLAMIGSTFSDNLTPPLILIPLALIMMVRFPDPLAMPTSRKYYLALILSGLLMGAAVGFKLCNCSFVLGLAAAWLVSFRFVRTDVLGGIALFVSVGVGFLIVNGEWMWRLYTEFQSPLFPFYNHIFKSPMLKNIDTNVPAWAAAHSIGEFLAYPYRWAYGIPPNSEWQFTDNRFAIISTLLAGLVILRCLRPLMRIANQWRNTEKNLTQDRQEPGYILHRYWFIAVWSSVSYLFWIDQFGALRYLMPVTLLTGVLMLMCIEKLIPYRKVAISLWVILALFSLYGMQPAYFGRVAWKHSWYPVHVPEQLQASKNTLYLKNSLSFMIPFFPQDAKFISIGYLVLKGDLIDAAKFAVKHHQGPIRTLTLVPMSESSFYDSLKEYGFRVDPRDCVSFMGGVYPFMSCRIDRITANLKQIVLPLPAKLQFTEAQQPWIKVMKGFYYPESDGVWTQGLTAEIGLFGVLPRKFTLTVHALHFLGENDKLPIKIKIGNQIKEVVFGSGTTTAAVSFNLNTDKAKTIVIQVAKPIAPHTLDPANGDTRELGMMLNSITIT